MVMARVLNYGSRIFSNSKNLGVCLNLQLVLLLSLASFCLQSTGMRMRTVVHAKSISCKTLCEQIHLLLPCGTLQLKWGYVQ